MWCTWKNIKKLYKNNKCKILAPKWNEKFELLDISYSVSDGQDCFEYITKKHEKVTDNYLIRTYVNKIENGITFRIKRGCYIELLILETMKLLGSTEKKKIDEDKNGENLLHLEIISPL